MPKSKRSIGTNLQRLDRSRVTKAELREAPPFSAAELAAAEIRHGDRVIRRGRPPLEHPKEAVSLRIDADVLETFRKTGAGWQTRINDTLRRAAARMK